ncbi:hypothetical protein CN235_14870, partial [Sinorhizobium meliloti]
HGMEYPLRSQIHASMTCQPSPRTPVSYVPGLNNEHRDEEIKQAAARIPDLNRPQSISRKSV